MDSCGGDIFEGSSYEGEVFVMVQTGEQDKGEDIGMYLWHLQHYCTMWLPLLQAISSLAAMKMSRKTLPW